MNKYPSIFNDVLAPVTPGPSSSNTCGACRIAKTCTDIFGEIPKQADIYMSEFGNFKIPFRAMRTDIAFMNGFLGRMPQDPRFMDSKADAEKAGLTLLDHYSEDIPATPPELANIKLTASNGRTMTFRAVSLGGGTFRIEEVDGCKVSIEGDSYELLLFSERSGALSVTEIKSPVPFTEDRINSLKNENNASRYCLASPVHPVLMGAGKEPPFRTSDEFKSYVSERGIPLWQAAVDYECAISGWTESEVLDYARGIWNVVKSSVEQGFKPGNDMKGIVSAVAPAARKRFADGTLLPLGALDIAAPIALSIMEYSNCSGTIVCIPTAGASGAVPAAIIGASQALGKTEADEVRALLTAGIIGLFMEPTKYFGAYGCQMEIGCASAMASSAMIDMIGGNAEQACCAAVMCLQSFMGLVCDKIAGFVQVPCISRNMTAVSTAMICANASMSGVESLVPIEETVDAMINIGKALFDNRINRIGSCATETAKNIKS